MVCFAPSDPMPLAPPSLGMRMPPPILGILNPPMPPPKPPFFPHAILFTSLRKRRIRIQPDIAGVRVGAGGEAWWEEHRQIVASHGGRADRQKIEHAGGKLAGVRKGVGV